MSIYPSLQRMRSIVPGSVALLFNLNVAGHANNTLVNNVGRNMVTTLKVKFGGEVLQTTERYDLLQTNNDLFLSKDDREDRLKQGISSVNMRKLRTNAGDKVTTDAGEVALASIELTFAPVAGIVIYSDVTKLPITPSRIWSWSIKLSQVTTWQIRREHRTNLEKVSPMRTSFSTKPSPSPNRMTTSSTSISMCRGDPCRGYFVSSLKHTLLELVILKNL